MPIYDATEQNDIIRIFSEMLWAATKDGGKKRAAGVKPPWFVDGSHWPAVWRHLDAWQNDEGLDPDSKAHNLIHLAWRALAIAYIETEGLEKLSRICARCAETKRLTEFPKGSKTAYFSRGSYCKACHADEELDRKWGKGEREKLAIAQGSRCAICLRKDGEDVRRLAVDHCHETERLRGLLCGRCNAGIGLLGENPEVLRRAIEYLQPLDKVA